MKVCPNCRTKNEDRAEECSNCGANLMEGSGTLPSSEPPEPDASEPAGRPVETYGYGCGTTIIYVAIAAPFIKLIGSFLGSAFAPTVYTFLLDIVAALFWVGIGLLIRYVANKRMEADYKKSAHQHNIDLFNNDDKK